MKKTTGQSFKIDSIRLLEIVATYRDIPVTVLGDLILDHYVWGKVSRVSPEAPVVVVEVTNEESRLGGAANVANNLVSLGASCSLIGVVGEDSEGEKLVGEISARGIKDNYIVRDSARTTSLKSRVIAHSQQVVRVDREKREPMSGAIRKQLSNFVESSFSDVKGLVISDYGKGVLGPEVIAQVGDLALTARKRANAPLVLVDPKDANFEFYRDVTVMKPNRGEAETAAGIKIRGPQDYEAVAHALIKKWRCSQLLITLSEDGMLLIEDGAPPKLTVIKSEVKRVFDVSGAGDTVSATYLLSLCAGASATEAAFLANLAAGKVVGEVGTATVSASDLVELINEISD